MVKKASSHSACTTLAVSLNSVEGAAWKSASVIPNAAPHPHALATNVDSGSVKAGILSYTDAESSSA